MWDVMLGTVRISLVARGHRKVAPLVGFLRKAQKHLSGHRVREGGNAAGLRGQFVLWECRIRNKE